MCRAEPRRFAHQGRRGVAFRSGPLLTSSAARPHSHWRGSRRRGVRFTESVGHGASRWDRHTTRRLSHRRAAPARTAHPGSCRHRSTRPHCRDDRPHRGPRRPWRRAPARRARGGEGSLIRRRLRPHPRRRTVMVIKQARRALATASAFVFVALATAPAYAAGSNMPWEQPLNQILESIQGPVAKVISVIVIIVTGLTLAFGETSGGFRRLIQIVFGLSIAFAASSFFLTFFQFGGGVTV